jgi:hypothetical protein
MSGDSIARWDCEEKAQFLRLRHWIYCFQSKAKKTSYFKVEATPPRRIVSLCSVNAIILARGYSLMLLGFKGSVGRGVTKNVRPAGD